MPSQFQGDDNLPPRHTKPRDQYRKNIAQLQSLSQISFYFCFVSNIIASSTSSPPPHPPTCNVVDIDESTYYTHHPITCSLVCRENQSPFTLVAQRHHGTQRNCGIPNTTDWHHQGIWEHKTLNGIHANRQQQLITWYVCVCLCVHLLPWTVTTIFT